MDSSRDLQGYTRSQIYEESMRACEPAKEGTIKALRCTEDIKRKLAS